MGKYTSYLFFIILLASVACNDHKSTAALNSPSIDSQLTTKLKESSQNYLKAWSEINAAILNEITIRNVVRNVNGEIASSNQTELQNRINFWHIALPDFKLFANEVTVIGNRTFISWMLTGTNTGMYGEMTPTGKKCESHGFSILTFDKSQQIIHITDYLDELGLMTQMGYSLQPPNTD